MSRPAELLSNWVVLLGAFVGIMLSATIFPFYVLGPLIRPLQLEFNWSRAGMSACLSLLAGGTTLGTIVVGQLLERASVRRVAIVSMAVYALSFGLFAGFGSKLWHFQLLYFVVGLLGAGCGPLVYTKAIGASFTSARGLALGIALSGAGVAGFMGPLLVQFVAQAAGWRGACAAVAALVACVGIPIVSYALQDAHLPVPSPAVRRADPPPAEAISAGVGKDLRFYLLLAIILTFGLLIGSLIIHLVPMLVAGGMSPERAALVTSLLGLTTFAGRLIIGWLLDRVSSTFVGAVVFVIGAIGALALATGDLRFAFLSVIAFGLITGAELDLLSFITLRYFGVHRYGKVYGRLFSAYTGVSIVGPLVGAAVINAGGYRGFYTTVALAFIGIAGLYLLLGQVAGRARAATSRFDL